MHSKKVYFDKYDPENEGLRQVFDFIYRYEVRNYGIKSNMVAVSGESIDKYIDLYIPEVIGNIGKAIIMELHVPRLRRIKEVLKASKTKLKDRIKILRGTIIDYEHNPLVNKFIKTPARFLDLGIGTGINDLTALGRLMLHSQQKVFKNKKKKVIILNAARRGVSDANCIRCLNSFLEPIGQRIVLINGRSILKTKGIFTHGIPFSKESNYSSRHKVVLEGHRQAQLTLYTYTNGSSMLTAVLKYR